MSQAVQYSLHIPVVQIIATVAVTHILCKSSLLDLVGKRLDEMIDTLYGAGKSVILDSPVISLVTSFTYAAHQLITHNTPSLSLATEAEGSLKVAAFVGGVFALKSALSPLLEKVTHHDKEISHAELIRNTVVRHFFPLAVGTIAAYYAELPVKLTQSALYTAGLIGVVKLLGKGLDSFLEQTETKATIQSWYAWMTLEKA